MTEAEYLTKKPRKANLPGFCFHRRYFDYYEE